MWQRMYYTYITLSKGRGVVVQVDFPIIDDPPPTSFNTGESLHGPRGAFFLDLGVHQSRESTNPPLGGK